MKKNAFTLVELLAVIVILAIILAIAVPSIANTIRSSKISSIESDAKMVLKTISYKKLENENFDATQVNKTTITNLLGLSSDNYSSISIAFEDNDYVISIVGTGKWDGLKACGTFKNIKVVDASEICSADKNPPVITLLGNSSESITVGSSYSDPGATAADDVDGNISSNIIITMLLIQMYQACIM